MDGPSGGGGGDNRGSGGGWQGQKYDATNQIKQFLGVPMEEDERPVVDEVQRTPPQIIPRQRQAHLVNEHLNRSGSPSNRHQRMDSHRYHDGRHHVDGFDTHGRNQPRHYDMNRTLPHRYNEIRHRQDSFDNLNRGHHRMGHDRGYNSNFHNHYNMRDSKDQKDMRPNGPRHLNASGCGPGGMVSDTEAPDFPPSPEVLAELEEEFVYPLKKKSLKFPKAKFFCRLCDYHCDSLLVCGRHVMDSRHRKLKEAKNVDTSLKNMPVPTDVHVTVIDRLVRSVAEELQVSPQMMEQRKEVVAQLNDLLTSKVEGCHLEMVGSSLSGFCLKTSDINIDILMVDNLNPSTALLAVRELVGSSSSELFKDVVDDLSSSYPTMAFTHAKTGLRMVVGACSPSSRLTNQLLADYAAMDPRVKLLGIAFRYWAQLCQIDIQARGTLPPHVFPLMVVHFLQQHEPPVIPVLHMLQDNSESDGYLSPARAKEVWQTKNTQSIGKLWLEMFQFYTVGFKATEHIINVRQFKPMTRAEKTWNKKIAVEDPFLQKRNLTRTVSGNPVFEYIIDRFKSTYRYFAIPQLSFGPLFQHIAVKESRTNSGSSASIAGVAQKNKKGDVLLESLEKVGHSQSEESSECEMEKTDDDLDVTVEGEELDDEEDPASFSCGEPDLSLLAIEDTSNEDSGLTLSANGIISPEEEQFQLDKLTAPVPLLTPSQAAKLMAQVLEQQFVYKFDGKIFKTGVDPPLICRSCQKDGHSKAECREDELPPLNPLPPMKPYFINQLTEIFEHLMKDFEPTLEEIEERDQIVADLEFYIRQFFRGVTLKLFGSSANGFGFQRSDLDICLTFEGNPTGKGIDYIKVIASLAEKLKKYRQCSHVFAITTAKVPIVKFSIRRPALEGDLSLYNTLALQNTKLLATYAKIDNRVKCLGYGMKYFAKLCDIGDASRGSLSSYAYILMVLHFLQQCKPPVIPVLQELYDHSKPAPQLIIDNWNAWFYSDLKSLPKVWKGYRRNKESVGQLWVSMLRYYTETFNWKENVVTIRQHAPLTRLQKLWNSRCIVIEDPFDLSHNLGAGLSRKMNTFIMKAFIKGREVFGSPINFHPQNYKHLVDYLFDTRNLTDGAPPNDRGCRFCGKIGHIQKDCPKRKLNIERKEKRKQQKERQEQRSSALETKREETHKPDLKYVEDSRVREKSRVDSGPKGNLPASAKHPEGITVLRIPMRMLRTHINKWESSIAYQRYGYKLLGMIRFLPFECNSVMLNKRSVVILNTPADDEYKWAINMERADKSVMNFLHASIPHYYELYEFLLNAHAKYLQELNLDHKQELLPENIGEALHEKIKEITTIRKQKCTVKKKMRYIRKAERAAQERAKTEANAMRNKQWPVANDDHLHTQENFTGLNSSIRHQNKLPNGKQKTKPFINALQRSGCNDRTSILTEEVPGVQRVYASQLPSKNLDNAKEVVTLGTPPSSFLNVPGRHQKC
ncbi:Terminal uridylyltransferase 4 [Halocaridina rubra]|uniref:Terminal uridylyltransferase 4 n=1 Tax=Halocaridina rubra TaxID=373956 RepID=A0AAN9A267_HALRR